MRRQRTPSNIIHEPNTTRGQVIIHWIVGAVILLATFLRLYHLGAHSVGNAYYAATVKSMLTSWHNFFFAACEPGGAVTVDKPPLGFWVQAASAYVFGLNGFALALPQTLAGVLSVPLLYKIVKQQFDAFAGIIAAAALTLMPITIAVERNNTIDGLLLFILLWATWSFLQAKERGRLRDLLVGVALVGVGFNIKMIQAFMPLPALYAFYVLGAPHRWWKRLAHLALATGLLVVVSLWWVILVDVIPVTARPFVGSSTTNSALELVIGHNALSRLGLNKAPNTGPAPAKDGLGNTPRNPPPPPAGARDPHRETGKPGLWRLFQQPLAPEASWLLPFVILGVPLLLINLGWQWPLRKKHLAFVLWFGWLLPELVYFSFTTGIFHAHYLIMLGPPIAALTGATAWALAQFYQKDPRWGYALSTLLVASTVTYQTLMLHNHAGYATWAAPVYEAWIQQGQQVVARVLLHAWWAALMSTALWLCGIGLTVWAARRATLWIRNATFSLVVIAMLIAPLFWSLLTTLNPDPDVCLPRSGLHVDHTHCTATLHPMQQQGLDHLLANTESHKYLLATISANDAAAYILATGRPVLPLGGFTGNDNVIDVDGLAYLVQTGQLRFIQERELAMRKPALAAWVDAHCQRQAGLYDCGSR